MGWVPFQDPYPGRCKNYREGRDAYGNASTKRCLLYEINPHICRFEPDPPPVKRESDWGMSSSTYKPKKPEPWVSPLDAEDNA